MIAGNYSEKHVRDSLTAYYHDSAKSKPATTAAVKDNTLKVELKQMIENTMAAEWRKYGNKGGGKGQDNRKEQELDITKQKCRWDKRCSNPKCKRRHPQRDKERANAASGDGGNPDNPKA